MGAINILSNTQGADNGLKNLAENILPILAC